MEYAAETVSWAVFRADGPCSLQRAKEQSPTMGDVLKVAADSKPKAVAGALAAVLREKGSVELQAVGAGAVNQAVKAIAITRGFVAPNGIDLIAIPAFTKVNIDGEERTAIRFLVQAR